MNKRVYQNFFVCSDIFGHQKKKQINECNCNVLIFRFNLIPNTIGLLLKKNMFFSSQTYKCIWFEEKKQKKKRLLFFSKIVVLIIFFMKKYHNCFVSVR